MEAGQYQVGERSAILRKAEGGALAQDEPEVRRPGELPFFFELMHDTHHVVYVFPVELWTRQHGGAGEQAVSQRMGVVVEDKS